MSKTLIWNDTHITVFFSVFFEHLLDANLSSRKIGFLCATTKDDGRTARISWTLILQSIVGTLNSPNRVQQSLLTQNGVHPH